LRQHGFLVYFIFGYVLITKLIAIQLLTHVKHLNFILWYCIAIVRHRIIGRLNVNASAN